MQRVELPYYEAAILGRLVVPDEPSFSRAMAEGLLTLGFNQTDKDRMHALAAKARAGILTPEERAEVEAYSRVGSLIPAGAENYSIEADHDFRHDVHVTAFMPHMQLRGKDFVYQAHYPDGKKETLLSVPRYNFNWQSIYRADKPIALAKGTKLHCLAHYDNSSKNPHNPDPTKKVFWGDQTWEEMMVGWIDYYRDDEKPGK